MIPSEVSIYLCTEAIDMRYGFDRLCQLMREYTRCEPERGGLFVFSNKAATRLKVMWFEQNGVCVLYKRLHRAHFELPLERKKLSIVIDRAALAALLQGKARPRKTRRRRGLTPTSVVRTTSLNDQGGAAGRLEGECTSVRARGGPATARA